MLALALVVVVAAVGFAWPAKSRRARIATGLCGLGIMLPIAIIADVALRDGNGAAAKWPMWIALLVSPLSPALGHFYGGRYVTRGVRIRITTAGIAALLVLAVNSAGRGLGLGNALGLVVVATLVALVGYVAGAVADLSTVVEADR